MTIANLTEQLNRDEGRKDRLYLDCCGKSWKECHCPPDKKGHLTGGVGRNFDAVALGEDEIDLMLDNDIRNTKFMLNKYLPWSNQIDDVRQEVLLNMCFNMGIGRLMGFSNMIAAAQRGDWDVAADELMDSDYGRGVTKLRAKRLATQLKTGVRQ